MNAGNIGVDFGRLQNTQSHLVSTKNNMNTTLEDLKAYLRPMVATWSGEASTSYQGLQHKWDTAAADLNHVLDNISRALQETVDGMHQRENSNRDRFQS